MIIFVGGEMKGHFAYEVAERKGIGITFIPASYNIKDQVNDICDAAKEGARYIIFDVDEYCDDAAVIADQISKIRKATGATPIILSPNISPENTLVRACLDEDIKAFICDGGTTADKKDELEKNMNGYFSANERQELQEIRRAKERKKEERNSGATFKTISIAGTCHRIGTTTQAIQITKYLTVQGYRAAYVEINDNQYKNYSLSRRNRETLSYVEKASMFMDCDKLDQDIGLASYSGIDMFYRKDMLPEVLEMGYDFYVYDYGVFNDMNFNKTAFLKDDLNIFVCGASPAELDISTYIAQNVSYEKSKLIYSFVSKEDQASLLLLMKDLNRDGSDIFFAEYTPSPFTVSDFDMYKTLLSTGEKEEETDKKANKERKGLFSFFNAKEA